MPQLHDYLDASQRENTRRSYASALRHFEVEWRGFLPATPDSVARYLAEHAAALTLNTLRQRLAALARWHSDHGFPDPTRTPLVKQVLKGIRALHPAREKRARPLQLDALEAASGWLERSTALARDRADFAGELRHTRDHALLPLGFWRGFRGDELVNLRFEHVEITPGEGLSCYLPRTKGDRQLEGRTFRCPALSRLCPVAAYEAWAAQSGLTRGPVFRKIDRWGHIGEEALAANSLIPLLLGMFAAAGIEDPDDYSSHSLRRGFAGWAHANGWDLQELMAYVGWRDVKSAMRYLGSHEQSLRARFERGLIADPQPTLDETRAAVAPEVPVASAPVAIVHVYLQMARYSSASRGLARARRFIDELCLARYPAKSLNAAGDRLELSVPYASREALDETIYALLDEMHRICADNQCFLEASVIEPATAARWE